ncbi:PREDICTED: methyl-CpG-binding domain protein 1 isoform X2 [Dipodomys ordii]|uniref:Methyl-CpG-binding domain protein 1 n=1 Tax=Dipodomys ordii TaxID=10020 RepID=A0A1S3FEF9_DIPOR|nr:PREDICTED: methyl-CpG-binding domain protein 1 isoform X2 [Dipodomys ordii]
MAEDWLDCPALGPGWKRREVYRKSGVTCGRSDIYYQSPTGDRIRSKVELTRYLGPACDLTLFNFKQGILCHPASKGHSVAIPSKKQKKASKPVKARNHQVGPQKSEIRKETPKDETKADTGTAQASFPAPGCCENCGISFSRDGTKRQWLKTLCKDCRAQRIAFNREQRKYKRVGCGECAACLVKEDCGTCSTCLQQLSHDAAPKPFCKCERRRCLRIVEKGKKRSHRRGGCNTKKAPRRRSQAQPPPQLPASKSPKQRELHTSAPAPSSPAEFIYYCVEEDELQPYTNRRQNRKCGACAACLRRMDCGHCDFCCDKPKFGGSNHKRQKCRWRQCLQFAMKRLLPSIGSGSKEGAESPPLCRRRKRPSSVKRHRPGPTRNPSRTARTSRPGTSRPGTSRQGTSRPGTSRPGTSRPGTSRPCRAQSPMKQEASGGFVLPPPGTDLVFLREGASSPVQVPGPAAASTEVPLQEAQCSRLSWVVQVKQEKTDTQEEWTPGTAILTSPTLQPDCPSKAVDPVLPSVKQEPPDPEEEKEENKDNCVSQSAPEEETGGAGTPVITEIFSLGGTRFRDTAVWLPRCAPHSEGLHKLLAVNENEYFTELQLKEEAL